MKNMNLNMDRYHKVATDGKTSTLKQHDTGHTITIAHSALPREQRAYLNALPLYSDDQAKPEKPGARVAQALKQHYAAGTDDAEAPPPININIGGGGGGATPEQMPLPTSPEDEQAQELTRDAIADNDNRNTGDRMAHVHDAPQTPPPTAAAAVEQPAPPPTEASPPPPTSEPPNGLAQPYQQQVQGLQEEAKAKGVLGQKEETLYNKDYLNQQDIQENFKQAYSQYNKELESSLNDVKNGYVKPEQYWDNHSKIATGIGIILAGFNPTNRPNAAIEFLKSNIDRDTQAQAVNLSAKNNLVSHNLQKFGNLKDAMLVANATKATQLADQLHAAAAQATNPLEKARFDQMAGQLGQAYVPQAMAMNLKQAMMQNAQKGGDPSSMLPMLDQLDPEKAAALRKRLVPGLGVATVDVTPEVRGKLVSSTELQNSIEDLEKFRQANKGAILKGDLTALQTGQSKVMNLQQLVREAQLNTVFRESEKPLLKKFVDDDPTSIFSDFTLKPQLHELSRTNQANLNTLKSQYGLPVSAQAPAVAAPAQSDIQMKDGVPHHLVSYGGKSYYRPVGGK